MLLAGSGKAASRSTNQAVAYARSAHCRTAAVRQREHEERAAQSGVLRKVLVSADGAEAGRGFSETRGHADAGPATDTGIRTDELLAAVLIRKHVADDSGGRLELEQLLAVLRAHGLEVALERAVEHEVARGGQRTGPHGEALGLRPYDLARARIPRDEVTHAAVAVRGREHREGRADVRLTRGVLNLERLVRHADVIGRHHEEPGLPVVARRLLVFRTERGRADVLHVHIGRARRVFRIDRRTAGLHVDAR